jgi:tetratricopeptide (TPR) repeat protein
MSQTGLDKAVTLFEAAAQRNGPLRLAAWLRQAEVHNQLNQNDDARLLYDVIIKATSDVANLSDADLEARCAALCGRGRTLLLMAAADPKLYADAVQMFDQLRDTPGASLLWRRQALTEKGHALEKMGEPDAALSAYDDALNAAPPAPTDGTANTPEWTWFYRAGTDAAHLLESRAQWAAAVAVYKKLAAADGPMKSDFENRLNQRRLEHYIWEE